MKIYNKEYDERSHCYLVLATMELNEYKDLIEDAFKNKGNVSGQRDVISQSSVASKIRTRMSNDFINGAVFPQVVIGLLVNNDDFNKFQEYEPSGKDDEIIALIKSIDKNSISIIDGMQRTNIYFENSKGHENRHIRVEFYVTTSVTKLLYRMLVLNTGQVPWNTRRQLEVIYSHLENSVKLSLKNKEPELLKTISINSIDDKKRRRQSGVYNKSTLIEMYLTFNTRNTKVNLSNEIAEEFQRFDMMESVEKEENFELFIDTFILLCKLDLTLGQYQIADSTNNIEENESDYIDLKTSPIRHGKDFFTNVPVIMGFMAACSEYILGAVTVNRDLELKKKKLNRVQEQFIFIIQKIATSGNLDFMEFETLNSSLSSISKRGNIGENQRKFFKDAFMSIIKYDDLEELPTLGSCWREQ